MTAVDFLSRLQKLQFPLFQTKDIAEMFGLNVDRTGKYLEILRKKTISRKGESREVDNSKLRF